MLNPSSSLEAVRDRVRRSTRKRFGIDISKEEEVALYLAQNGCCALCGDRRPPHGLSGLYVDHDHATGRIRALLCSRCNRGLGNFRDNPELMRRAAAYLERFRAEEEVRRQVPKPL